MFYPGEPKELAEQIVAEWARDPATRVDPVRQAASIFRSGSRYHARFNRQETAETYAYFADFLDALVAEIREAELDYDGAASISGLARGTIKNKKRDLGNASRGKVKLGALPLSPVRNPGLSALRAIEAISEQKALADAEGKARTTSEDDDNDWAKEALRAMAG